MKTPDKLKIAAVNKVVEIRTADPAISRKDIEKQISYSMSSILNWSKEFGIELPKFEYGARHSQFSGRNMEEVKRIVKQIQEEFAENNRLSMNKAAHIHGMAAKTVKRYFLITNTPLPWSEQWHQKMNDKRLRKEKEPKEIVVEVPATELKDKVRDMQVLAIRAVMGEVA
ncbi:hypothetical protein THIOSC15_1260003 [uncultured Thiomicrorhabdus sp.]